MPPGFWYLLMSGRLRLKLLGLSLERSLNFGDLRSSPQMQEGFEHFSHFLMVFGDFDDFEISGNRDKLGRSKEEFIILLGKLGLDDLQGKFEIDGLFLIVKLNYLDNLFVRINRDLAR